MISLYFSEIVDAVGGFLTYHISLKWSLAAKLQKETRAAVTWDL